MPSPPRRMRSVRDVGATLRGRRIELGLSQQDVADAAGVSRQWLSGVEAGKQSAEIGLVLRVLDVLEIDVLPQPRDARREDAVTVDLDDVLAEHRQQ